jgi:ELWxxDGT repeat protein
MDALEPRRLLYNYLSESILPDYLTSLNGALLYVDNDGTHGTEIWRTDGTQAGTRILKDINPGDGDFTRDDSGSFDLSETQIVTLGNVAYFQATDGVHGRELWRTDGTSGGTKMVADLEPGEFGSEPTKMFVFKNELYFTAFDPGAYTAAVWKTGGSAKFVRICDTVESWQPFAPVTQRAVVGNELFFINTPPDGGPKLYRTDGTAAGTHAVTEQSGIDWGGASLQSNGGRLFVFASGSVSRFDPATGALTRLATGGGTPLGSLGNRVVYTTQASSYDNTVFVRLLATDGTSVGTVELWNGYIESQLQAQDNHFTFVGNTLYFNADALDGAPLELWKSDGTVAGTKLVKSGGFSPFGGVSKFAAYNGKLAFVDGIKLWTSDGTAAGTVPVADLPVPPYSTDETEYNSSSPPALHLTAAADKLFFVGLDDANYTAVYAYRPGQPLTRAVTIAQPASLDGSVLTIDGTFEDDVIRLTLAGGTLTLAFNTLPPQTYAASAVTRIIIHGSSGKDAITLVGNVANAAVYGGADEDTLTGGAGNDLLDGGEEPDSIAGGGGNDTLHGGVDALWVGSDIDTLDGEAGDDALYAEGAAGSMFGGGGNDYLQGGDFYDTLDGGDGDDYLFGGRGGDHLTGGAGADTFSGWKGIDTIDYSARTEPLSISLDGRRHDGALGERDNVMGDIEAVLGGAGDDLLVGSAAGDYLFGAAGNDTLYGANGNDTLDGGIGVDMLDGGRGDDTFYSGADNAARDYLFGGTGIDRAQTDRKDQRDSIEKLFK